jgi:hypothetical protein
MQKTKKNLLGYIEFLRLPGGRYPSLAYAQSGYEYQKKFVRIRLAGN